MDTEQMAFQNPTEVGQELNELLAIVRDAAQIHPRLFLSSVFGLPWTWLPPYKRLSEYKIIDIWRLPRTIKYFLNISIPSIPLNPPSFGPPFLNGLFWRPTVILQRPDHNGSYTSFPGEAWFFINGILTNDSVAQINAALIADLFHRPITLIQNTTSSFLTDMLECALGKQWHRTTEAVEKAFPPIHEALKSHKKKVVVIAHSQGTIIISIVLDLLKQLTDPDEPQQSNVDEHLPLEGEQPEMLAGLRPIAEMAAAGMAEPEFLYPYEGPLNMSEFERLTKAELAKLEIYCFANCANHMVYFDDQGDTGNPLPWIESYGNEQDIVARLGMLAPNSTERSIKIQGPRYMRKAAWGHLLNEHYLLPIEAAQRVGRQKKPRGGPQPFVPLEDEQKSASETPRLYYYINGGSPPDQG